MSPVLLRKLALIIKNDVKVGGLMFFVLMLRMLINVVRELCGS